MRNVRFKMGDRASAIIHKGAGAGAVFKIGGVFTVVCRDKDGNFKWQDTAKNTVVNAGLQHILDTQFVGGTPVTTWYLGLTDGTPTVDPGDTMSSHAGWTEVTAYDAANRVTWTETRTGQNITNAASPANFVCSTNATTVGGCFLVSNNTKGGSTGTLWGAAAFSGGDKSLDDGDTIDVTYDVTAADA